MGMKGGGFLFQYRPGLSFVHRFPPMIKVALLFICSLGVFFIPVKVLVLAVVLLAALSLVAGISPRDGLADLKPAVYYGGVIYGTAALRLFPISSSPLPLRGWPPLLLEAAAESLDPLARIVAVLLLSSLLFRTTSLTALKTALARTVPPLATPLSLFLGFIPVLFEQWEKLEKTYRARGGKPAGKLWVLLPALLSLAFYQAEMKAQVLAARES